MRTPKQTFEEELNAMIFEAIEKDDRRFIGMVCKMAAQSEDAKQILRKKGYGWTGLDLLGTVELVPSQEEL